METKYKEGEILVCRKRYRIYNIKFKVGKRYKIDYISYYIINDRPNHFYEINGVPFYAGEEYGFRYVNDFFYNIKESRLKKLRMLKN